MKIHLCESKMKDSLGSLSGITFIPMIRIEFIANVAFISTHRVASNAAIANQLISGFECDRELELEARFLFLMFQKHLEEITNRFRGSIGPFVVSQIERLLLVRQHSFPI